MLSIRSVVNISRNREHCGSRGIFEFLHAHGRILHSENGIYAIEKPINVLSHPNKSDDCHRSIINAPYNSSKEAFEIRTPQGSLVKNIYLLNRLDSATSGIIMISTDEAMATMVKELFARRLISKVYKAIVFCDEKIESNQRSLIWQDTMEIKKVMGHNRAVQSKPSSRGSLTALTNITITEPNLHSIGSDNRSSKNMMMIELRPATGYTHQLRYQCALHSYPIVGDKTYGNFGLNKTFEDASKQKSKIDGDPKSRGKRNADKDWDSEGTLQSPPIDRKRLYLHSFGIEFRYECNSTTFLFKAVSKLPTEFVEIIRNSYDKF